MLDPALTLLPFGLQAFRMTIPREYRRYFGPWYEMVGWASVDNLVFAFVQAVLFLMAWRRLSATPGMEREPLLHNEL